MNILKTLKNHPDGATIDPLTYRPANFSSGYAVSLTNNTFKNATSKTIQAQVNKLKKYARTLNIKNYYLGYWRDESGTNYLDLTVIIKSRHEAIFTARLFNQQAIFNFKNFSTINL